MNTSQNSDGITMKYQIGVAHDMNPSIISHIGIILTIDDFDLLHQATSTENVGPIPHLLADTTDENVSMKRP